MSIANELKGTPRPVRRKLLKKIILILEALLITAFVMAEENGMKKYADTIQLNSGFNMPTLGLGTWTLTGATCENAVYAALKSGYRLIDTAKYYGNESEVGNAIRRAIKDGICKREEIFVTTKLVPWSNNPDRDIDDSLKQLGFARITHLLASHWYYLFMSLHIGLHVGRLFQNITAKIIPRIILALVCAYGIYAFISRGGWKYLILQQQFFFFDLERGYILFALDYISIIILFATISHFIAKLLKK